MLWRPRLRAVEICGIPVVSCGVSRVLSGLGTPGSRTRCSADYRLCGVCGIQRGPSLPNGTPTHLREALSLPFARDSLLRTAGNTREPQEGRIFCRSTRAISGVPCRHRTIARISSKDYPYPDTGSPSVYQAGIRDLAFFRGAGLIRSMAMERVSIASSCFP